MHAYQRKSPDLDVKSTAEELFQVPRLGPCVAAVPVHTVDDELGFALVQEMPRLVGFVREVDQSPVSEDTQETCQCALNDEDPAPSIETLAALQLHQPVCQDTSAC